MARRNTSGGRLMTSSTGHAFSPVIDDQPGDGEPAYLVELHRRGRASFSTTGLPNRRQEDWRLTPLKTITDQPFVPAPASGIELPDGVAIESAARLVFVNGHYSPALSENDGAVQGLTVTPLSTASTEALAVAEAELSKHPEERNAFASLNAASACDGALVHVASNLDLEQPVQVIFITNGESGPTVAYPRLLVVTEPGSKAVVVENHLGLGTTLSCPVTELAVADNAELEYVLVEEIGSEGRIVTSLGARIGSNSELTCHAVAMDGTLVRNNAVVSLTGEGSVATLNGLCMATGRQHLESHLRMEHLVPNCQSHQLYRGVLDGRSRVAFTGRIVVAKDAQKTDANQANHSLLLSDKAVVNSNPQLEIFADDVKCTHGSTVGELDEDALFYLRTRGISRDEAEGILTFGFASDLVERIPVTALAERLEQMLLERLPTTSRTER